MVRKRSKSKRINYEEEVDSDSDVSLDFESPVQSPAPKKYSLRERKRPLFIEDLDYDEDEVVPPKPTSEDEDYQVEVDLLEKKIAKRERPIRQIPKRRTTFSNSNSSTGTVEIQSFQPVDPKDVADDSAIDFEDIIRADVVVNKNRIDFENMINRTEIMLEPTDQQAGKKKRGRPAKTQEEVAEVSDTTSEFVVAVDPLTMVADNSEDAESKIGSDTNEKPNGLCHSVNNSTERIIISPDDDDKLLSEGKNSVEETPAEDTAPVEKESTVTNSEVKNVENKGKECEKMSFPDPSTITDEELLSNCHIENGGVEFHVHSEEDNYDIFNSVQETKYDDTDDIIIIEPTPEIIILDDDD